MTLIPTKIGHAVLGFAIIATFITELAYSGESPKDFMDKIAYNSSELAQEKAHEAYLERSEAVSRAKSISRIDASIAEDYVRGDTDSGFLSSVQIRIPILKKDHSGLFLKASQLERDSYAAFRKGSLADRLYRFRLAYYDVQGISKRLPDLLVKRRLLAELAERQRGLLKERLKDSEELNRFYGSITTVDEEIEHSRARLGTGRAMIRYLSGGIDSHASIIETVGEPPPINIVKDIERRKPDLIMSHPETVRLSLELDKQNINSRIASMEDMPEISGVSAYAHDPRFSGNENQLFGGIEARLNLWDFGANRYDVEKEEALSRELMAKLENTRSERTLTIDDAIRLYESSYRIWKDRKAYVAFRQKLLTSVRRRFLNGEASWKEFAMERIRYIDEKMALEEASEEAFKNEANLIFALGRSSI